MKKYKIYSGLGGGFGGATYQGAWKFHSKQDAMDHAYQCAVEIYESYEGMYGLTSYQEWLDENDIEESGDAYYEFIADEMESWLDYDVEEVKSEGGK